MIIPDPQWIQGSGKLPEHSASPCWVVACTPAQESGAVSVPQEPSPESSKSASLLQIILDANICCNAPHVVAGTLVSCQGSSQGCIKTN